MTRPFRLSAVTSTLSFRLFIVLFLSILLLFTAYLVVSTRYLQRILERQVEADAGRHGDIIIQGLFTSMLRAEREHTYSEIAMVGAEPGIEVVRIYNKDGDIRISSDESEIGSSVNMQAEACYGCHASASPQEPLPTGEYSRTYEVSAGYRVLGLITPIRNAESCWNAACHVHPADQSVLGVLDVQMSMELADAGVAASRRQALILAVIMILVFMALTAGIVYRGVYLPTRRLHEGTRALASGNLDARMEIDRSDELGKLAASFNDMASSLQAADTELRRWSQTLEDRIEEKRVELERIHQNMMLVEKAASLGRMAATVAHELNNPLSGILTYARLVGKKIDRLLPSGGEKKGILDNLELIGAESMRCGNIVRDLLTYARQSSAEMKRAHLNDLIERALKLVAHHIELGGIETRVELALESDEIICDPDQIMQALIALMINAVEAMPDGGHLRVKVWEAPDGPLSRIAFSVSDTGVGIPDEALDRIFDPFFSTKDETKGVGLGLAVVYGIVQRHEGTISVESEVGKGTAFTIEMPRDPERAVKDVRRRVTQT